ncbi:hypothetical protein [Rubritalea tangerina]|uniref:hypothetical protein n=1 Tax=Rubritalea tangerina TaxID=430798 RepID=UPI003607CAAB
MSAKAVSLKSGKVLFERENGKTITVPLSKLKSADQEFLNKHFRVEEKALEALKPKEGKAADDLPFPLGKTTGEIQTGGQYSYFLYLPTSLRAGEKHPVLFVMSPGGGGAGNVGRYKAGAERNRWIIAVSKQSKNGFNGSQDAVDAMMEHVLDTLPIDEKRMYTSGFSGGSRMACMTSAKHSKITGVIACGAANAVGSKKQVVYGLCGTNCFNRTDMAHSFKEFTHKGSVLRYFPGRHVWANGELCEDAITHLNGVFLAKNESDYSEAHKHYNYMLGQWITELESGNAMRAFMWADFAQRYDFDHPSVTKVYGALESDEQNVLFVKGLYSIRDFAEKTFGKVAASQWKADPKVSAACVRESEKYEGSPWREVLLKLSEDAQKF